MRSHPEQTTSPPLMVHAVRARGPGAGGVGGDSGRARDTADTHSPEVLAASLDGAVRSRAPWVGYRASLLCRSADRSGTRAEQLGPELAGLLSVHPPGRQARRDRLGSGRAPLGLCRDQEPGALRPALRPSGTGPPVSAPCCGPHAARVHTMPALGVRSAPPAGAFSERGAIFSFSLLRGGRPGKREVSRWQRTWEQVPIRLGSPRTGGEARGVAGRRGGRGPAAGGWVCSPASDEGGDRRRDEALGGSAAGRDPLCPVPCAPPPLGGARRVWGGAARARALLLLAFPPPLPTIGRH